MPERVDVIGDEHQVARAGRTAAPLRRRWSGRPPSTPSLREHPRREDDVGHRAPLVVVDAPRQDDDRRAGDLPRTSFPGVADDAARDGEVRDLAVRNRDPGGEALPRRRPAPIRGRARRLAAATSPFFRIASRRPRRGASRSARSRSLDDPQLPDQPRDRRRHERDQRPGEQRAEARGARGRTCASAPGRRSRRSGSRSRRSWRTRRARRSRSASPSPRAARPRPSSSKRRRTR